MEREKATKAKQDKVIGEVRKKRQAMLKLSGGRVRSEDPSWSKPLRESLVLGMGCSSLSLSTPPLSRPVPPSPLFFRALGDTAINSLLPALP